MPDKEQEKKSKPKIVQIKEQLAECQKLRDEYLAGWKRAKADFENLQKDIASQSKRDAAFLKEDYLLTILGFYENFVRAKEHLTEEQTKDSAIEGLLYTGKQIYDFLKSQGLEEIESKGKKFDPCLHEAIGAVEANEEEAAGAIVQVISQGYKLNGRVLRPAKVKVAK